MAVAANQNIAQHLPDMAERQPDALSVVIQGPMKGNGKYAYTTLSAKQLDDESNRIARGLSDIGIGPGVRTVLMVKPSVEFFALTFALFKAGAIPVMVDPGMGTSNLKACLAEAEPDAFIGITKAHAARVLLGWGKGSVRINVTVGRRLFWGGHTLAALRRREARFQAVHAAPDDVAAILFTSGSTGIPKGAVYTHGNFQAQVAALRDHYGIEPGERDLATFPLFALFGPALGMAAVVPDMDASRPITADPAKIIAAIKDYETTNLFASPALIECVGRYGADRGITLPSVRRVISAGAPADNLSVERFTALLSPGVEVMPSYGATEALPVASIGSTELLTDTASATDLGAGVCVGRPVARMELRIVKISDEAIPEWSDDLEAGPGEIGEICVKGPVVTRSYYNRPESTALAKISHGDSGDFYHRMGDVGYLDESGRLWMCGRKSHRVEMGHKTLFTIPCERIIDTIHEVHRSALVGVSTGDGVQPVLCIELNERHRNADQARLRETILELASKHSQCDSIKRVLFHKEFPVDVRHNAKIFRERLALWAAAQPA